MKSFKSYMKDFGVATIALLLITAMYASNAHATDVNVEWTWPATYCSGDALAAADLQAAEVYVSDAPIPRVVSNCDAAGPRDTPPSGAIIANVPVGTSSTTIDLACGKTYHFVVRAQAKNGAWGNFSAEASKSLDCGRPDVPITVILT